MRNIAIITARSGSKGLKDKNIKELAGKPLIAYTIESAIKSQIFDVIMVSTDSEEYAEISKRYGASVPFLRSHKTSTDEASSWDVVEEVLQLYEKRGEIFDNFCLLQPTSPLRNSKDIIGAYEIHKEKNAVAVISMCEVEHPIAWCGIIGDNNSIDGFVKRDTTGRRQTMQIYHHPNGAMYFMNTNEFRKDRFFYRDRCYAYIMPKERSVDIDSEVDFKFAEFLLQEKQKMED